MPNAMDNLRAPSLLSYTVLTWYLLNLKSDLKTLKYAPHWLLLLLLACLHACMHALNNSTLFALCIASNVLITIWIFHDYARFYFSFCHQFDIFCNYKNISTTMAQMLSRSLRTFCLGHLQSQYFIESI